MPLLFGKNVTSLAPRAPPYAGITPRKPPCSATGTMTRTGWTTLPDERSASARAMTGIRSFMLSRERTASSCRIMASCLQELLEMWFRLYNLDDAERQRSPAQHVEQGSVDCLGRFVDHPVSCPVDDSEVERGVKRREQPAALLDVRTRESIARTPDPSQPGVDRRKRPLEDVGGWNAPRLESTQPDVLRLNMDCHVVDRFWIREHQASKVLRVRPANVVVRPTRRNPDQEREGRERHCQTASAHEHRGAHARPETCGHETPDDASERESRDREPGGRRHAGMSGASTVK